MLGILFVALLAGFFVAAESFTRLRAPAAPSTPVPPHREVRRSLRVG